MFTRIFLAIVGLVVVVGLLVATKVIQIQGMMAAGESYVEPAVTVSSVKTQPMVWETTLSSVGTLEAVQGVTISAEVSGKISEIDFEPGQKVKKGDVLFRQETKTEEAQLHVTDAAAALAKQNIDRARRLLNDQTISQQEFDSTSSMYKQSSAQTEANRAIIAKKTIRAPFAGRLGIRMANLGQTVGENDAVVTLQTMDPIFVNFTLPQQQVADVQTSFSVRVTCDAAPGRIFKGAITAINPQADAETRNVGLQATLDNADEVLRPGMFVNVEVLLPKKKKVLAVPVTAVLYAPYGDSVFVIDDDTTAGGKVLREQFVTLGESRGDFVALDSGVKPGEDIVATGVFKFRNGQKAEVDNSVMPPIKINPTPEPG